MGNSDKRIDGRWVEWVAHSDATQAWPFYLAELRKAEYGVIASGGMSWLRPSHSGIPALPQSWDQHYKDHPRDFHPAPDEVYINMGTNDGTKDTTAAVTQFLQDLLPVLKKQTQVQVIIPFGQMNREPLTKAVAGVADPRIKIIDLGPNAAQGLTKYGIPTPVSPDGLHPNAAAHREFAHQIAARLR